MSVAALVAVLLAFAFGPAVIDVVVLDAPSTGTYADQSSVNALVIGKLVALLFVVLPITWLRWWPVVLHEQRRVRAWVWSVPIAFLAVSIALIDYNRLTAVGLGLSLTLFLGTLMLATGEELLFRGMVLTFMRDRYRELIAAVAGAVVFGLSHIVAGPVNVVASALFGYLMYYTRRVSGGIIVPIVVHALYDFSVWSSVTTDSPADDADTGLGLVLLTIALVIVMIVGRKRAEPALPTAGT